MSYDSWTFVYVADMQPGSPRSFRYRPAFQENWDTAKEQIIQAHPELLLIGGDITRDGNLHDFEFQEMKAQLDAMQIPYHAIAGNMDTGNKHAPAQGPWPERDDKILNITSAQVQHFEKNFGPVWWTTTHKNLRISGLCDMLLGSGLPEEKAQWDWLEAQVKQSRSEYHIWLMHSALFIKDLHEPNWDITQEDEYRPWYFGIDEPHRSRLMEIFKATGTNRVITGHIHCQKEFFTEGIHFDLAPATCFSQMKDFWPDGDTRLGFLKFTVSPEGLQKTFVPLKKESTRTDGYGPGGHPKPEARDYSLAWVK